MTNYTRYDLSLELSLKLKVPVDRAKGIVDHTLAALRAALGDGRKVEFRGFGSFDVVTRKPKIGRNPLKPEAGQYQIPSRRAVRFRAGKDLTDTLNPEQP